MSATKEPSPFLSTMVTSAPFSYALVHAVVLFSMRSRWSRQPNLRWSLRISAPGRRWDSHRIWKPLQMPSTGIPFCAAATTSVITGANRAIAPQRR